MTATEEIPKTPLEQKLAQCESVIKARRAGDPVRIRREAEKEDLLRRIGAEKAAADKAQAEKQ